MFMGEYAHTVDAKGRLIVPAKFREQLGSRFIVTKGLDQCIYAYPESEWQAIAAKLSAAPLTSKQARRFMRVFVAGAASLEIDKQGRVLLPVNLREYAGLSKDVVLLGVLTRIEIWSKERLEDTDVYGEMEDFAEEMAELGLTI